MHTRSLRLFVILLATAGCLVLLAIDAMRSFPHHDTSVSIFFLPWISFGFSALVAVIYLAVGSLVWFYARGRLVAHFLFVFSCAMAICFAIETATTQELIPQLFVTISGISSALAIFMLFLLLLIFPKNYFRPSSVSGNEEHIPEQPRRVHIFSAQRTLYSFVLLLTLLLLLTFVYYLRDYSCAGCSIQAGDWLYTTNNLFYVFVLLSSFVIVISGIRHSSTRQRQQLRIFVSGVIVAIAPLLMLTILPDFLNLPDQYVIDGKFTAITMGLLPLALGYSILRYQIMVFDSYIRRAVIWIVGIIALAIMSYIVITLLSLFLSSNIPLYIICITVAMAVLAPCTWWLAQVTSEYIFFSEARAYRRMIEKPELLTQETIDINDAARLLSLTAMNVFETEEVCLYVLDEDIGSYRLYPQLKDVDAGDAARRTLIQMMAHTIPSSSHKQTDATWLDIHEAMLERVEEATRPLLLSEATTRAADVPVGLQRYLTTDTAGTDPLLTAVRAQGKMIGLLVLGKRGDRQPYAGPDFEAIHLILARFSSVLETARLYVQASQHVAVLDTIYSAGTLQIKAFESLEEVAIAYAKIGAEAIVGGAGIWFYEPHEQMLHRIVYEGSGPTLGSLDHLHIVNENDWSPWFSPGNPSRIAAMQGPSCLPQVLTFPFAWLPLVKGDKHVGMLVLTYPRPHVFSSEEKRILEIFAGQCATALENARITIELRQSYEYQKHLDNLKDQFISMASHELKTPITSIKAFTQVLQRRFQVGADEQSLHFLTKMDSQLDKLTRLTNDLLDVSRMQAGQLTFQPESFDLDLLIQEVVENLQATNHQHQIVIEGALGTPVVGDKDRIGQVLINLITNAIKFSPQTEQVSVYVSLEHGEALVSVQDCGIGIAEGYYQKIFERFFRVADYPIEKTLPGLGIGLYISSEIIKGHHGRIWVESAAGKGSTFHFIIPLGFSPIEISQVQGTSETYDYVGRQLSPK